MNTFRKILLGIICAATFASTASAREKIIVASDATFKPFEYVENGNLTGFDIELMNAIGKKIDSEIEWVTTDFKGLIPGLVARRFNIAISAIYITDERLKVVDFSNPYYAGGLVALVKKDNATIKSPGDLAGKSVSVQVGTKSVAFMKSQYPTTKLFEVEKNDQMFSLVQTGRADAAVTGKPAALLYAKQEPSLAILKEQLTTENYGIAIRKDQPELTEAVNKAIVALKDDGTYSALVAKYFGE